MHVATADTGGSANIGLYAFATDTYCILGPEADQLKPLIEEVLQVPVIQTTIAGTSLAGVFCAGNEETLLVPSIIFDHELERLKKAGINVEVLDTTHTALGNNIIATNDGVLVGPMFSAQERDKIAELLDKDVNMFRIADIEVVGSSMIATSKGGLIHRDASQFEQDMALDTLRVPQLLPGSVNMGVPYVRSGIIANKHGFLIGSASGGPEITNADEALGFLNDE